MSKYRTLIVLAAVVVALLGALLLLAPGSAFGLGSVQPGHYNNWAAHNVIASNYGGWCGKRLSRICMKDYNYAHCGPVWPNTDGYRSCTGSFFELSAGVKYYCKWRGGIFRADPNRVVTILPLAPCTQSGHL